MRSTHGRLFDKRQKGELDEEVLAISGQLLQKNPDVYTFWNIRRQALILISQKIATENGDDEAKRDERLAALYKEEMILTEACIQENPKSYGAWLQRGWVLERTPKPEYQFELKLCNLALRLDERNFHCWDHRRIVCRFANIPLEDELKFSDEKVNDNFSNYSAWHYRSSLLARTHPDPDGRLPMDEATLAKELGLATNAFYTDPEDQSAWFYTSWLFDDQHAFAEGPVPVWVTVDRKKSTILLVMSGAVEAKTVGDMIATDADGEWIPADSQAQSSQVWLFKSSSLGPATKVTLSYKALDVQVEDEWTDLDTIRALLAPANPEGSLKTALEKMLASCQELATVEPHNKWPTFIATLCMRRLEAQANHDQILSNLEKKLPKLDPKRAGMYADLANNIKVNRFLVDALAENSRVPDTLRMIRKALITRPPPPRLTWSTPLLISLKDAGSIPAEGGPSPNQGAHPSVGRGIGSSYAANIPATGRPILYQSHQPWPSVASRQRARGAEPATLRDKR
uniref:Geranylgeranyl transferase type-2 subunit alpha n=1 Tax=Plectus sambesii TaxID=2011161 RepID=A0A914WCV1_9BILA